MINFANTNHVTHIGISYLQLHIHNPEVANTRFQYKSRDLYWPDECKHDPIQVHIVRISANESLCYITKQDKCTYGSK